MPKPSTSKEYVSKFIKPDMLDQDNTVSDTDVSPSLKKEGGPVPPPKWTLEQLLATYQNQSSKC
ncbi:MAG: hypothetical protein OXM61_22990 [Candidatus Poribacteria bacterium]|nr:hypothetical protein [Candidatus Poribacteria bacterium]